MKFKCFVKYLIGFLYKIVIIEVSIIHNMSYAKIYIYLNKNNYTT